MTSTAAVDAAVTEFIILEIRRSQEMLLAADAATTTVTNSHQPASSAIV